MTAPPAVFYVDTPNGTIACRTLGDGPLELLLLNPMSRSIENLWDYPANAALLDRLARFSRLTVFDRRGTGISDPLPADLPPTWEDWLDDTLAVLDYCGISDAVLLAERDAASAAMLFASSHPERVRALVACNTSARFRVAPGYTCGERHERAEGLSEQWAASWGTARMVAATRPTLAGDPAYVDWVTRMQRVAYSPRRAAAEFRYIIDFDARAVLRSIRAPTLILHRQDFTVVPAAQGRYLADHIPGARFVLLQGGDMDVLLPGDDQPLELVESFLVDVRPAASSSERVLATVLCMQMADRQLVAANLGDARWHETLLQLDTLVRAELARFQGRDAEARDDRFLFSFDGPARALRFAAAVRRTLRDQLRLEIQAGVHVGECERNAGVLSGPAVQVSDAVLRASQPGEVLVTSAVGVLVTGSGIELRGIGAQRLDGVDDACELFALEG